MHAEDCLLDQSGPAHVRIINDTLRPEISSCPLNIVQIESALLYLSFQATITYQLLCSAYEESRCVWEKLFTCRSAVVGVTDGVTDGETDGETDATQTRRAESLSRG